MAEPDVIPTSASIASTGLGIRYIGGGTGHAFAYSGQIAVTAAGSADTTVLNFTTSSSYFLGKVTQQNNDAGGDQLFFRLKMNGQTVMYTVWDSASTSGPGLPSQPWPLIIPPYTKVEVIVGCSSGVKDFTVQIVGRVYGEA